MALTHAGDISITIGGISIRVGDLRGFMDSNIVLANGMKIKASEFEIQAAKRAVEARAKEIVNRGKHEFNQPTNR